MPLVEFAHNNAPSSSTGLSPFLVCFGKNPRTPMSAVLEDAHKEFDAAPAAQKKFMAAADFFNVRQEIVRRAQAGMHAARQRMKA